MDLNLFTICFSFSSPTFRERRHTMQWWRGVLWAVDDCPRVIRAIKMLRMTWQFYKTELRDWIRKRRGK